MFSITDQVVKMTVSIQTDKDGTERIPAMKLVFSHAAPNDILSEFSSELKGSLYRRADLDAADMADRADPRNDDPNYLPKLRNPEVKNSIQLTHELIGATVVVHYGTRGKSDISLEGCRVDSFTITPQEGGTVHIQYECFCHPTKAQAGDLYTLHCREVTITICPPAPSPQASLTDE